MSIQIVKVPERDTEEMKSPKKIIQKKFQKLKDELSGGLSTRSGIKIALHFNKNKWKLEKSIGKLFRF